MKKIKLLLVPGILLVMIMALNPSMELAAQSSPAGQYEVLSPWGEADPIPLRGLTAPRVDTMAGKKIGLFVNYKRAARPSGEEVEKQMKALYPDTQYSYFESRDWNADVIETKDREKFIEWIKSVDAIVATIGD